jgi:peptidyl-prolyl cis-trans isomerase D
MLQQLREKTSGWIATVILGLLIIPFAFFGMDSYLSQRVETHAARIQTPPAWWQGAPSWWPVSKLWQREDIDAGEFRKEFELERQQQRQQQGEAFDLRAFEQADNKRRILDRLIDMRVLRMASARAGIVIGDAQVRDTIQGIAAFQVDGKFNPERYQLALASQIPALTPRQFEDRVREGLQQALLPTRIAESAFVTDGETARLMKLLGETRDVAFLVLPKPGLDTAAITGAELAAWYKAHAHQYRAPESVTIEYVEVDAATLPVAAADEAALRQRYEQEQARFVAPEQRLASHILIRVEEGADQAAQQAAEQKANALAVQAKAPGADFAALAKTHSDDSSASAGGDLGWLQKGATVAPFEQALFAMQPGEVRGPIKTDFGWHVIQLREAKTGQQVPFELAREELARGQVEADRERAFNDLTGRLVDLVYKNPTSLAPAARALNLPVLTLGPFARDGGATGIAANPALQRAAFSESLIQDGTVSDPIEIAPNHSVLIRVAQHTPARALPLPQVRDQVIAEVRADRTRKAAEADAEAMLARLRKGETLQALAAERGLAPTTLPGVPRGAPVPDRAAAEAIFAVPRPAAGKAVPGRATLADGGIALFVVDKVTPGDPAEAALEQRQQLRQQLAQMRGDDDAKALVAALRKRMQIEVAEDRL